MESNVKTGNIMNNIEDYLNKCLIEDKVLIACRIDGIEFEDPVETITKNINNSNIKTVEIYTQSRAILLLDTLKTAEEYITNLIKSIQEIAIQINSGNNIDIELWRNVIEGLEWIITVCMGLEKHRDLLSSNMKSLIGNVEGVNEILTHIVEAMNLKDMVTVGDILEYELVTNLEEISSILRYTVFSDTK